MNEQSLSISEAVRLVREVEETTMRLTESFPGDSEYGLSGEMRNAIAVVKKSIATAEACETESERKTALAKARDALPGFAYHIGASFRFGYITRELLDELMAPYRKLKMALDALTAQSKKNRESEDGG